MQKTVIDLGFSANERSEIAIEALVNGSMEGIINLEDKIYKIIEFVKSYETFCGMSGS